MITPNTELMDRTPVFSYLFFCEVAITAIGVYYPKGALWWMFHICAALLVFATCRKYSESHNSDLLMDISEICRYDIFVQIFGWIIWQLAVWDMPTLQTDVFYALSHGIVILKLCRTSWPVLNEDGKLRSWPVIGTLTLHRGMPAKRDCLVYAVIITCFVSGLEWSSIDVVNRLLIVSALLLINAAFGKRLTAKIALLYELIAALSPDEREMALAMLKSHSKRRD